MDAAGAHLLTLLRGQHYDGAPESLLAAIDVVRRTGTLREADRRDLADLQKRAEALVEHVTGKAWCAFPTVDRDGTVAGGRLLYVAATFGSPPPGVPVHAIPSEARDEVRAFVRSLLPGVAAGEIELWITDDRIRHRSLDAAACVAAVSLLLDHPVGPGFAATGVLRDGRLVDRRLR